jgi:MoaA/NifB/PqqE/SkfB family radical SAM enzyme
MVKEQTDHRGMLSEATMNKIPEDAWLHGIKTVIFSGGGDPLLNKHTIETSRRLKKNGIQSGINTQGYHLTDASPFDFVRFSVDAASRETYQKIHGVDGWERVNWNIRRAADLRKYGVKIELGLAFLVTPWNWQEAETFCEWSQQYEPDFVHIRPAFLAADYLKENYADGDKQLRESIIPALAKRAEEIKARYKNVYFRVEKFDGFWTPKIYSQCRANSLMAVTSGDGAFLVCQDRGIMAQEDHLRWGDYNTQTFREIWWSEDHKKVMGSIDLDKCPRCVMNGYNEIIEHCFVKDGLKMDLL